MQPRPTRGPAASIKTLAPGTGSPCVLTTWPTRLGPAGEKAGMLGGKVASGARVETCESVVPAVPDLRGCCAVRPSNTPPSTTAASKQTGASQASRGLASSLMAQSLSHMTIPEKGIPQS